MGIRLRAVLGSTALMGCLASPAFGQSDGAQQADRDQAAPPIDDIVVTARGRQERLLQVPVVVSAQSAADIQRYNAQNLGAIGDLTPTVIVGAYKGNAGGSLAIRGISSPANQTGFEQAVSVAVDGVQTSNGRVAQLGFFDIQQVEVLKGPQALFFGKNSPAGVISVTTADPTKTLQVTGRAAYEFIANESTLETTVSGPLSDAWGARVAVRYRYMDGWLRNTATSIPNPFYRAASGASIESATLPGTSDTRPGDKEILGRVTLAYDNASPFTAKFKLFGARLLDSGPGTNSQNIGPCTGPNPRVGGIADPNGECRIDNRTTVGDVPEVIARSIRGIDTDGTKPGKLTAYSAVADLAYDLGNLSLSSVTGYNYIRYLWFGGIDQTTFSQLAQSEDQTQKEFSQQLRLSSNFDGPINFMIGAYYQKVDLDVYYDLKLNDGNYQASSGRWASEEKYAFQRGSTISAFGQLRYAFAEDLELSGGVRWTREKKRMRQFNVYGIGTFNTASTAFAGSDELGVLKGRFKDDNFSPEATLTWHPDRDKTVFIAYKTGFKSGGFGLSNPLQSSTTIGAIDFESEKAKGVEIGAKGLFLGNKLRLSAALFRYDFSNLQVNTYDPALIAYTINNAGKVKQKGAEIEANFRVSSVLSLHGAASYVDNKFSNFIGQCYAYAFPTGTTRATAVAPTNCSFANSTTLALQQDFSGRAPARSPKWAGNAGFLFDIPAGEELKVGVTGDAFYSSGYYAAETMAASTYQSDFWRLNASVSVGTDDDRYKISLIGRNLTNKYYVVYAADRTGGAGVPGSVGEQRGVVSRGREITIQAAMKF